MLRKLLQVCFLITGGTIGALFLENVFELINIDSQYLNNTYVTTIIGALLFYALTFWAVGYIESAIKWIEEKLIKTPLIDTLSGTIGLLLGLLVSYLLTKAILLLNIPIFKEIVPFVMTVLLGYLGLVVGLKKRSEFTGIFAFPARKSKKTNDLEEITSAKSHNKKILDTNVIIDGRIADICQAGFLEGTIIIPQFVLSELQYIADSSDTLKRARGRRGLDVLNRIQKEFPNSVEICDEDFEDVLEVDSKLIRLAKKTGGILVTNDFNLNKLSEFQKVKVLNINDLSNAVKPVVIPGEDMQVVVIKDGKEHNQGVAYLDDGTMIVVDDGRNYMNQNIQVTVTSVLQTSAGRMIFAKPKTA